MSKVLTFSAALQKGIITPTTVLTVPDHLKINDVTIHDDWFHNPLHMTATGIIAESSNIGTLKIAQKLGPTSFMDYAERLWHRSPHRHRVARRGQRQADSAEPVVVLDVRQLPDRAGLLT